MQIENFTKPLYQVFPTDLLSFECNNFKKINYRAKENSLFITVIHQVKYINEKKNRVMVMQIENITKPLY